MIRSTVRPHPFRISAGGRPARAPAATRSLLLAGGLILAACAHASEEDRLAAVRDLGRVNGQALACGLKDTAAWVRVLMLNHAPKTRAFGEAYEEGTQEAFSAHGKGAPCPQPALLAARLDEVSARLRAALPVAGQVPAGHSGTIETESGVLTPRYLLQDPNGRAIMPDDFRGRFQLVSFGYTSCPDVCPTTLLEMKEVLRALGEQAARVQPIFISVDPERDSAQVLREYTAAFDARILGLRGTEELTRRAAAEFKVRYEKVRDPAAPEGSYTVDHSAGMILVGPDGQSLARFPYATPAKQIAERIDALLRESGSHPQPRRQ